MALPKAEDIALILHTSGTTSRPKIVPLLQSNVAASARNIAASLSLTPADRCLNVMPLFHIHGLVAAVAASFAAGGRVYCTPGFNALTFFAMLYQTMFLITMCINQVVLRMLGRKLMEIELKLMENRLNYMECC
jgi:acyl-CoA synthetase (AMP-forming)/AMP-acid ligase II